MGIKAVHPDESCGQYHDTNGNSRPYLGSREIAHQTREGTCRDHPGANHEKWGRDHITCDGTDPKGDQQQEGEP